MSEKEINQTIERLRSQMVKQAVEKGSLLDDSVVAISQQLDSFLLIAQYAKIQQSQHWSVAI